MAENKPDTDLALFHALDRRNIRVQTFSHTMTSSTDLFRWDGRVFRSSAGLDEDGGDIQTSRSSFLGRRNGSTDFGEVQQPDPLLNEEITVAHSWIKAAKARAQQMERILNGGVTAQDIELEQNQELRQAMLRKMGFENYVRAANFREVKKDEFGRLLEKHDGLGRFGVTRAVAVINSTAEPDGSFKEYILAVPPDVQTPKEGIAWTFGLREEEYNPQMMT